MDKKKDLIYTFEGIELWSVRQDSWWMTVYQIIKDGVVLEESYRSNIFAPGLELFEKYTGFERGGRLSDLGPWMYKKNNRYYMPVSIDKTSVFGPQTFLEVKVKEGSGGYFTIDKS